MSERKQKNLRLGKEYHEQLENLAQEWFDSRKKQGHVVEKLLDLHGGNNIESMIKDVHENVVTQSDENNGTHTKAEESEKLQELIEKAEADEEIDPDEWELEQVKNRRGISKAKIFIGVCRYEYGRTSGVSFNRSDVRKLIQETAGYGYNGANQIARNVCDELVELPDMDEKLRSISDMDTTASNFFSKADLETGDYCFEESENGILVQNIMELRNEVATNNARTGRKIADWLEGFR